MIGVGLLAQVVAAIRVVLRLIRSAGGPKIARSVSTSTHSGKVSVIVPVLNEELRLGQCLEGLTQQGADVAEILVVDGGSVDATQRVTAEWAKSDTRICFLDASPVPVDWNGKPWGLHVGLEHAAPTSEWILTIDADVRPERPLVPSLLAHAERHSLRVLSVATPQMVEGPLAAPVHTSLLASLVYRYGIPGHAYTSVDDVQANGQCCLIRRDVLSEIGGFASVARSLVEDVTLARHCVAAGIPTGFFETAADAHLLRVEMYKNWYDTISNWTRSLPMRDRYSGPGWLARQFDVVCTIGLPVPMFVLTRIWTTMPLNALATRVNLMLLVMRIGTQAGMRRAYLRLPVTHCLAVVLDPLSVAIMCGQACRRTHTWRGRIAHTERHGPQTST